MKTKIKKTFEITLILNKEEALWLKELVQNPLSVDEDEKDKMIREEFWNALPDYKDMRSYGKKYSKTLL